MEYEGETYNFAGLDKFRVAANRQVRYDATRVTWQWFVDNRAQLDRIYDDQVKLRDGMAKKLGFDDFIGLAYKRMKRVDYSQADVEKFRNAVRVDVIRWRINYASNRQSYSKSIA